MVAQPPRGRPLHSDRHRAQCQIMRSIASNRPNCVRTRGSTRSSDASREDVPAPWHNAGVTLPTRLLLALALLVPAPLAWAQTSPVAAWRAAHEREILDELLQLVALPNVAGKDDLARNAEHLQRLFEKRGFTVERFERPGLSGGVRLARRSVAARHDRALHPLRRPAGESSRVDAVQAVRALRVRRVGRSARSTPARASIRSGGFTAARRRTTRARSLRS